MDNKKNLVRLNIEVPEHIRSQLKQFSAKQNIPLRKYLTKILLVHLANEQMSEYKK